MSRTRARRIAITLPQTTEQKPRSAAKTKASRPKRLGFDWGGGTSPSRRVGGRWRDTLGWPWSGGGALGWPGSGGGPLGHRPGRQSVGLGYHPDLPDFRDLSLNPKISADEKYEIPESVKDALDWIKIRNEQAKARQTKGKATKARQTEARQTKAKKQTPPGKPSSTYKSAILGEITPEDSHDLRWTGSFSPVEDQGEVGSCTAQAIVGLVEYLMAEGGIKPQDMSRMFLYKVTRNLLGWTGDTGAYIRSTIKAMALFGTPPEHEWPYDANLLDAEPDAYHYSFAQNFRALTYARVDRPDDPSDTLGMLQRTLYDGFPVAFGLPVYSSIDSLHQNDDVVPFPTRSDRQLGGHAVLAVGYDDRKEDPTTGEKGAVIFRNSWSGTWGEAGYAYLPYTYVLEGLARDFWTIFNREWTDLAAFE